MPYFRVIDILWKQSEVVEANDKTEAFAFIMMKHDAGNEPWVKYDDIIKIEEVKKLEDVVIQPDGTEIAPPKPEKEDGSYSLAQLQKIVGGYIQILETNDGRMAIFNEEGKLKDLEPNIRATALVSLFPGDYIVGNTLICDKELCK